jgi:subtilisin family serine protease
MGRCRIPQLFAAQNNIPAANPTLVGGIIDEGSDKRINNLANVIRNGFTFNTVTKLDNSDPLINTFPANGAPFEGHDTDHGTHCLGTMAAAWGPFNSANDPGKIAGAAGSPVQVRGAGCKGQEGGWREQHHWVAGWSGV